MNKIYSAIIIIMAFKAGIYFSEAVLFGGAINIIFTIACLVAALFVLFCIEEIPKDKNNPITRKG